MSAAAALDEIAGDPDDGGVDELRDLQRLDELADYGRDIARAIAQRVQAAQPDQPVAELQAAAMAYARVARAVRLTVMLKARLAGAPADAQTGSDTEANAADTEAEDVRKFRVERIIERVARARHADDEDEVDRLTTEAAERLDDDDLYGGVLERPMSELIALICRDLDLTLDWSRLAGEAWARQEIAGGQPGWPLAALASARAPPATEERAFRRDTG
jgi:hypothetical protein